MSRRLPIFTLLAFFALLPVLRVAAQQNEHGRGPPSRSEGGFVPGRPELGGGYGAPGRGPPGHTYPGAPGGGFRGAPYGGPQPFYRAPPPLTPGQAYAPAPGRRSNSLGADWRPQQEEARTGVRQGQLAPLGRVIEGLQRRMPGRQLDTGLEYDGGRAVYRVRWMTAHGRRVDVLVDAATGAILGEK